VLDRLSLRRAMGISRSEGDADGRGGPSTGEGSAGAGGKNLLAMSVGVSETLNWF